MEKIAPIYDPAGFDIRGHALDELIRATCTAELTHEIAAVAGWLTLVFAFFTDDWQIYIWIFVATAFVAGAAEFALSIFISAGRTCGTKNSAMSA